MQKKRFLIALLIVSLLLVITCPTMPPTYAEASNKTAWLEKAIFLTAEREAPPDYDGALWMAYHGASETDYYSILVRKSDDAYWDLFSRSGACVEMDKAVIGEGFYRYIDLSPFSEHLEEAPEYSDFDQQTWWVHPLRDSRQLLFLLLAEYYYTNPIDSQFREQGLTAH